MNLEDHRTQVLAMLSRCQAPESLMQITLDAPNIQSLQAVCYAYMAYISDDLLRAADYFEAHNHKAEAARMRTEARLAKEPWNIIMELAAK